MKTKLRRLLRNVPVLRLEAASTLAVLIATFALLGTFVLLALAVPVFAADAPDLPPGVTPQQVEAAKQAIQSGAPLPPDGSTADLKDQLPPDLKAKVEEKLGEKGGPSPPPRHPRPGRRRRRSGSSRRTTGRPRNTSAASS